MEDFNSYAKRSGDDKATDKMGNGNSQQSLINLVSSLAAKYDGKNTNELIKAVYEEAKKGKRQGTLTNKDIDNFSAMLSPMLDDKKRKMLRKIVEELKNI